jgi:glycosyltransferase involved in cell wall biosynthesis
MISFRWPPSYGGAGKQAQRLAVRLASRGIAVTALTARHDAALAAREVIDGVPVRRLGTGPWRSHRSVFFFLSAALYLFRHAGRIDVVHVLGAYLRVVPVVSAAKLLGKKTVVKMTSHGTDDPLSTAKRPFGRLVRAAMTKSDAVISLGGAMSESYRASGLAESKLVEIPNGVETDRFRPVPPGADRESIKDRMGIPYDAEVVTFVGPVSRDKGVDTLLLAWPQILDFKPRAYLLLVGPLRPGALAGFPTLESLSSETMRIRAAGEVDDVYRYLRLSDVFVLPTRFEGLPNSLLEAMAAGLACVASRIPATEEIAEHGSSAVLVEPGDPSALAEAIAGLLDDPEARRSLGAAARARIEEKYAMEIVADKHAELYRRIAGISGGSRETN